MVLERAAEVGGTWRDNTYPGCQCDVPSRLYSLSFAPNPDWSRSFSRQGEIQAYLRRLVREHRAGGPYPPGLRCDGRVLGRGGLVLAPGDLERASHRRRAGRRPGRPECAGDPAAARGRALRGQDVPLGPLGPRSRPDRRARRGRGYGRLGDPVRPAHPPAHRAPARLPAHAALGPSSTDRPIPAPERWAYRRVPALARLARAGVFWTREAAIVGMLRPPAMGRAGGDGARATCALQVRDRELRRPPDARTTGSVASGSCSPTTSIPRCRRATSSSSPTPSPRCGRARW